MSFNDRDGTYTVVFQNGDIKVLDRLNEEVSPLVARELARRILDQVNPNRYVYVGRTSDRLKIGVSEEPQHQMFELERNGGQTFEYLAYLRCRGTKEARTLETAMHKFLRRLGHSTFQNNWYMFYEHDAALLTTVLQTFDPVHAAKFLDYASKLYLEFHLINLDNQTTRLELLDRISEVQNRALQRHAYIQFGFV